MHIKRLKPKIKSYRIVLLLLLTSLLISCSSDCPTKLVELHMEGVSKNVNDNESKFENYYLTNSMSNELNFQFSYTRQGAGEFCDYSWSIYPIENGARIFNIDEITIDGIAYEANSNLTNKFEIEMVEENFWIRYLVKNESDIPEIGIYRFRGETELDDGIILRDTINIILN